MAWVHAAENADPANPANPANSPAASMTPIEYPDWLFPHPPEAEPAPPPAKPARSDPKAPKPRTASLFSDAEMGRKLYNEQIAPLMVERGEIDEATAT